jgi:glycosyltransferase involved in cell wall biosynthesis
MNIIHVMGMRSSKFGGLERFMLSLGKELHALNHKLILIYEEIPSSKFFVEELKMNGVEIIALPARGISILNFSLTFSKLLLKYNPSIVHCHFNPAGYSALVLSWLFRVKHRYRTLHGMISVKNVEVINQNEIPFKTRVLIKLMYRITTKIFCVSDVIKTRFGQIFKENSKISTIYLGVEDNNYNKQISRIKYNMPDKRIIACVAFHGHIKGIDILLEALAYLKINYRHDNFMLYQIGGGDENITQKLKNQATELNISQLIIWMGQQDNVPEILCAADIYCQPSRSEGIPLSIMEASIASLPVIASNVGGIAEAVDDGNTGFLIPKEDPILLAEKLHYLLSYEEQRVRMGENAKQLAINKFVIHQQIKKFISISL